MRVVACGVDYSDLPDCYVKEILAVGAIISTRIEPVGGVIRLGRVRRVRVTGEIDWTVFSRLLVAAGLDAEDFRDIPDPVHFHSIKEVTN